MKMERVSKNDLKITELELLSALPEVLSIEDGRTARTPSDFEACRTRLYRTAVDMQYGTRPPSPEFVKVELLYDGTFGKAKVYRITSGTKENPVSFRLKLMLPKKEHVTEEKLPVIVDGDMCFCYAMDKEYLAPALESGFAWALFDRTEIAPDNKNAAREEGPLYKAYPDKTFGALAAWAWGYSRVVDALEIIGITDPDCIAFTGHSRGGKTALLAGALDPRARIVNPNNSGAGGSGCYRVHMRGTYQDGDEKRSETLRDLLKSFPFWFGPQMQHYTESEEHLPFDQHFLKALVAPRVLFTSEAAGDIWANPVGTYLSTMATKPVYALYGKPENLLWYWRQGPHCHEVIDVKMLVSVMKREKYGLPLDERMFDTPFDPNDVENRL